MKKIPPSIDQWLKEAKADAKAPGVGMYLTHNGVVRESSRAQVRHNVQGEKPVTGMLFSYDQAKVDEIVAATLAMDGIFYVRVWLNEGALDVGDDIMFVLIGGDIRPRVVDALQYLVGRVKSEAVSEKELS